MTCSSDSSSKPHSHNPDGCLPIKCIVLFDAVCPNLNLEMIVCFLEFLPIVFIPHTFCFIFYKWRPLFPSSQCFCLLYCFNISFIEIIPSPICLTLARWGCLNQRSSIHTPQTHMKVNAKWIKKRTCLQLPARNIEMKVLLTLCKNFHNIAALEHGTSHT